MKYLVIDKTPDGACARHIEKEWGKLLSRRIEKQTPCELGDALIMRDCLQDAGFKWGKDFYLKKAKGQ
jgi:hypothetical protein